jgi:hypothetical protein
MKTLSNMNYQLHSRDYFVRIKASELSRIVFEHMESMQEPSVCAESHKFIARCGFTEWQGTYQNHIVSLGWDWAQPVLGRVLLLRDVAPRTNVRLIDELGYDFQDHQACPRFFDFIASLRWQDEVHRCLKFAGTSSLAH